MTMEATVLSVQRDRLVVMDHETRRRVIVHTDNACRFRRWNLVCIQYNGMMTMSIPPQISAESVVALPRFGPWRNSCR